MSNNNYCLYFNEAGFNESFAFVEEKHTPGPTASLFLRMQQSICEADKFLLRQEGGEPTSFAFCAEAKAVLDKRKSCSPAAELCAFTLWLPLGFIWCMHLLSLL